MTDIPSPRQLLSVLEEEHPFLRQEQERRQEERSFLLERIDDLEATIKKLQDQLSLNSQNSSQPPSTDQSRKVTIQVSL